MLIGQEDHDDVGRGCRFGGGNGFKAVLLRQIVSAPAGALPHNDAHAGITQVLRMGMALAPVADDGHGFALEVVEIRITVIIHFHCNTPSA